MTEDLTDLVTPGQLERIRKQAERRGIDPSVMASRIFEEEIRSRTRPKKPVGNVRPFRRPY